MRITDIEIQNLRGIRESHVSFPLDSRIICLIGAGDSTKSTLLKAIEWVFWPTWNLTATDTDFYQGNTETPIIIRGTIAEFPEKLLAEDKFGMYLRRPGVKYDKATDDEPKDDLPICLTIQLTIDGSLEPKWEIVCNRQEPRNISHTDRKQFSIGVIGSNIAKDLAWGKHSVLQKYADSRGILNEAYTMAVREVAKKADLSALDSVSATLSDIGRKYGVDIGDEIKSRLLIQGGSLSSTVGLFDGDAPLSQFGIGSQRLLSMGLNIGAAPGEAILLIDEVENGLEPFRLRNLINEFRSERSATGQILMTTHSSVAVAECSIDEIMVIHSVDGKTDGVFLKGDNPKANNTIQAQIRYNAESFLSRRLIVCEGRTEIGFIRAFDGFLASTKNYRMAFKGVSTADGNGETTFQCADILHNCGYDVCILMDSDKDTEDDRKQQMRDKGIPVFDWDKPNALEEQCFLELPLSAIQEVIQIAVDEYGCAQVSGKLSAEGIPFTEDNGSIAVSDITEEQRKALGKAAKKKGWYKRIGLGDRFGRIVLGNLDNLAPDSALRKTVTSLADWVLKNEKAGT